MIRVIGVGNPFRGDDGAGIEVVRRMSVPPGVEVLEHDGEPAGLLDAWQDADLAYVVDAVRADDEAGSIHRIEITAGAQVAREPRRDSSHALGLGDAVALARALDRLPGKLVLIGITGRAFETGGSLTPEVDRAVDHVARSLAQEVASSCA